MEFLQDICYYIWDRKKFLLVPLILVLILTGLILLATNNPYVAPFIYSLF